MRHNIKILSAFTTQSWPKKLKKLSLVGLSLFPSVILACGPDFPLQLTQNRLNNLSYLPQTTFSQQLISLAKPLPWQYQDEPADTQYQWDEVNSRYLSQTQALEYAELDENSLSLVNAIRNAPSLAEAEKIAETLYERLPPEIIWYTLGAMAFHALDYDWATHYLTKVIELPESERANRTLLALYTLSRIELIQSKRSNDNAHFNRASAYLVQLQEEVAKGVADPLRLGLASLGEQAYILLYQGQPFIKEIKGEDEPPLLGIALNPKILNRVIELYATQAVQGDNSGDDSLLMLTRTMMGKSLTELKPLLQLSNVQKLLITYWQSNTDNLSNNGQLSDMGLKIAEILTIFPTDGLMLSQGDKLAAIYYQLGDYSTAEHLIALAKPSGLTWWLSAKLMLQKGDQAGAAKAYAQAVQYFPTKENTQTIVSDDTENTDIDPEQATYCRIRAEQGVLSLERGEYLDALSQLLASGDEYWQDIAYVAERVLTTAELKNFIDTHVPAVEHQYLENANNYYNIEPINNRLRYLLGRRLLREDITEAPAYFEDPKLNFTAQDYVNALAEARSSKGIDSARAYWTIAELTREQGMEILGFELAPDYAIYGGGYDDWNVEEKIPEKEQQRVNASQAIPNKRFHYRYRAAELADIAADLVPHNSQAYAALLCHATGWVLYQDHPLASSYYKKYVANGPFVPWAEHFGLQCELPDFDSAMEREKANKVAEWNALYHKLKKPVALGLVAIIALFGAYIWRRRKRK